MQAYVSQNDLEQLKHLIEKGVVTRSIILSQKKVLELDLARLKKLMSRHNSEDQSFLNVKYWKQAQLDKLTMELEIAKYDFQLFQLNNQDRELKETVVKLERRLAGEDVGDLINPITGKKFKEVKKPALVIKQ